MDKLVLKHWPISFEYGWAFCTDDKRKDRVSYFVPESGLRSPYETNPLCAEGELDLDLRCFVGTASGDLERDTPWLLDLELDLDLDIPLSKSCWSSIRAPRRDFRPSLMAGRFSLGLGLRIGLWLRLWSL